MEQERIKNPSRLLQQNENLIIDIMLEMQATFRGTVIIEGMYNQYVPQPAPEAINTSDKLRPTSTMLEKTLDFLERPQKTMSRLKWAMVKRDKFKTLVDKLIGHNTYIEGLLDNVAM